MKRIEFIKVGMKNFCNYIDPMELEFENGKLITITGPNGVGKSTIFQAIPFTSFGVTSEGLKGDDAVNNEVGKNCHTWLEFKADFDFYRVDRYQKYTGKGNTVELSKNREKPYKVGQREVIPEIEKLLVPKKLFMNTLLFSQGIKDFFTDLGDSEKKEIFRKILQLDNYLLYHDEVKKRIKSIGKRTIELNQELEVKNQILIDCKDQTTTLKKAEKEFNETKNTILEDLEKEVNDLINERDILIKELDSYKEYIPKIEDISNKINTKKQEINELILNLKSSLDNINSKILLKENELKSSFQKEELVIKDCIYKKRVMIENGFTSKIQEETDKLNEKTNELYLQLNTLENEINSLDERIREIKHNVIDSDISICPTCYQEIGEKEKQKLQLKVKQYEESIKEKENSIVEIKKVMVSLKEKTDHNILILKTRKVQNLDEIGIQEGDELLEIGKRIEEVLKILNEKADKLINENNENGLIEKQKLESELKILEDENKELQEINNKIRQLDINIPSLNSKINMSEENIKQKENEVFDTTALNNYINKARILMDEIKKIGDERKNMSEYLEILEFWKIGYSQYGIPAMLIDDSIPFLNNRVAYYLDKIANGRYTVSFDTMLETKSGEFRDKISVNVLDNQTKANSRLQLSGGQTRLIDIATILTLNDLQSNVQDVSFNILLFDEIFDSLDDNNIGHVSNVIRSLTKDRFVSIISHRHIDQIEADGNLNLY